jgi:predicted CXXCH cytochrome family protein
MAGLPSFNFWGGQLLRNRPWGLALIGLVLLFFPVIKTASGAATPISASPHNFAAGGTGTGTIKAATETQICVFCHTPHAASTSLAAPLWNRQMTAATYTLYSSAYLTALGYPSPAVQPKEKSKICLSCHDGTIALGSVYNIGGAAGTIAMKQGAANITTMPATSVGLLGTNLADDHPVGFLYDAAKDPELQARAWPWGTAVKLDPDASTGTLECHTCHNAHDNQFKKFLRMSNANAALCTTCHNKLNYAVSGHATSTQAYTPSAGATATTVGENSCRNCHKPHTALGTPLTRGAEENTCYDAGCHGTNNPITGNITAASGTTWRNIQAEMNKAHAHPTNTVTGLHQDLPSGEAVAQLGSSNRHAECPDCHNPHQAQPPATVEKSTRGSIRISLTLKGTWGVEPVWPAPSKLMTTNANTFVTPATFNKVSGAQLTDEYQVCMKCHSNYVTLPVGARNIAAEINPGNSSYHGIVPCPTPTTVGSGCVTNYYVNQNTMVQPWAGPSAFTAAQAETYRSAPIAYNRGRVWCSDCHGSNASTMPPVAGTKTAPYGPHGSSNIGNGPGASNTDNMLVKTIATDTVNGGTPLCLACHKAASYQTGNTNSRGTRHGADATLARAPQGCFSCHMWENAGVGVAAGGVVGNGKIYPHGMNKRWATIAGGLVGSGQMSDSFNGGWYSNMDYTARKCWSANSTGGTYVGTPCNAHNGVTY